MVSKRDISRLLKKGLTGWEAGLLVFEDAWISSRSPEGFLSDKDISNLKANLRSEKDIDDYNGLIQLLRVADFLERQAFSELLAATAMLERAAGLGYLRMAPIVAQQVLSRAPQIMTKKQYQEERQAIIDRQRQRKLQELEDLDTVLYKRASRLAPEGWRDELDRLEREDYDKAPAEDVFLMENYPGVWPQAIQDILELIRAGKLRPVQFSQDDRERLIHLEQQIQAFSDRRFLPGETEGPPGRTREDDISWMALIKEKEAFTKEAYHRARESDQSREVLISRLERLKAGSLPEEEEAILLDYTFFLREDLYRSGLPEWKELIDTYYENLYEADLNEANVAIIPKPRDTDLDEKGYYNRRHFKHWPFAPMAEDDFAKTHSEVSEMAKTQIENLLAGRQVLREVSYYLGLALTENLDFAIQEILEPALGRYNGLAELVSLIDRWPFEQYQQVKPIKIDLEKVRPPAKRLAEFRGWIAEVLGEQWRKRAEASLTEPRSIMRPPFGRQKEARHES